MMSYRHSIASTASEEGSCDVNNNNLLSADNLLRLALKKPKSWNWELTTSSSSPNISFPKIQLFDGASGELMVEVDRPDCVIRSDCTDVGRGSAEQSVLLQSSSSSRELDSRQGRYRRSRTSLVKEKLSTSGDSLADIFNQLQNKGLGHKLSTSGSQYRLLNGDGSLQKSKSANAIGVQEAPPIVRRRSRRSLASRSSSILERISEFYGRSSTEEEDTRDLQLVLPPVPQLALPPTDPPAQPEVADGVTIEEIPADPSTTSIKPRPKIYKLVRSNIGTLMVREESFHTQRSLRRRQRENGEHGPGPLTQDPERLVELDEWTDRPRPMDGGEVERYRYEREINRIDGLLSRVMLSHDLQTEEEHREAPSICITEPPEAAKSINGFAAHQNGTSHRKRRTRRSVSVGGSVTSPQRRSVSSGRNHSPSDPRTRRNGRRSASSSSTEDTEPGPGRREQRTGSSSRSGSQKRRGRTRHRANDPDSSSRAAISNAPSSSSSIHSRTDQVHRSGRFATRRARRCSAESVGLDTLALERFRASLVHRPRVFGEARSHDAVTDPVIDEPTIDASAATFVQRTINEPGERYDQPQQDNTLNPDRTSTTGSSTGTLSTLSSWTSGSEGAQQEATNPDKPVRELGRSISVPSSGSDRVCGRTNFLERLRSSLLPASGDAFRQRFMMAEPGAQDQSKQPDAQPTAGHSEVIRRAVPVRRGLVSMASVVEQVLLTKMSNPQGRPPTGKRSHSAMEEGSSNASEGSANDRNAATVQGAEEDADDHPPISSELVNTVEPPYQSRRTLKYYTRRFRTSINFDS